MANKFITINIDNTRLGAYREEDINCVIKENIGSEIKTVVRFKNGESVVTEEMFHEFIGRLNDEEVK